MIQIHKASINRKSQCLTKFNSDELSKLEEGTIPIDEAIAVCSIILENILKLSKAGSKFKADAETPVDSFQIFDSDYLYDTIDLYNYMKRLVHYTGTDTNLVILTMMILDKLMELNRSLRLTERNIYKILFLCFVETNKFYDDNSFTNKDFSTIGGTSVNELLQLELEFLQLMHYQMNVDDEKFHLYNQKLISFWKSNRLRVKQKIKYN